MHARANTNTHMHSHEGKHVRLNVTEMKWKEKKCEFVCERKKWRVRHR